MDFSRRHDGEQQPGKAVALYEELKDRLEESRGGKRNGPITDASLDDGQIIIKWLVGEIRSATRAWHTLRATQWMDGWMQYILNTDLVILLLRTF